MSICASGASHAKAGVASAVLVDAAYVKSLLPAGLAWAYDYLPFMSALEIGDVGAFCALDPPTWTVPTAAQIFDFLTGGNLGNVLVVNTFLQNVAKSYLWHSLCECTSGATPAAPAAPVAPAGAPAVNPPSVVNTNSTPCYLFRNPSVGSSSTLNVNAIALHPIPLGTTSGYLDILSLIGGGPTHPGQIVTVSYYDQAFAQQFSSGQQFTLQSGQGGTFTLIVPPLAKYAQVSVAGLGAVTNFDTIDITERLYCGGAAAVTDPCCAGTQISTAMLREILQLTTLLQRYQLPFATIPGAVHSALSGTGQFAVSALAGLSIHVTSGPTGAPILPGNPVYVFDQGWLSISTADGMADEQRLTRTAMIWLPRLMPGATVFSWILNPGVVMTVTELEAEP